MILRAESADRAAFLRPVEVDAFRDLIALMLRTRTVAGPALIPEPLAALGHKLDIAAAADPRLRADITLTPVDEECLTLLRHQIALRERLPLRVQRSCVTCGKTKILNPNLVKKSKAPGLLGETAGAAIETVGMLADGHYIRAVLKVMGTAGVIADKTKEDIPTCEDCQGQEFDTPAVTYCPNCKKLRAETILLECPDCGADFVDGNEQFDSWLPIAQAEADFKLVTNAALFGAAASRFEKGLYGGQKQALTHALTGDDDLLCMCRCGRPGETLRSVALLLTTRQLIWARQLVAGDLSSGAVPWSHVARITTMGFGGAMTIEVETHDGRRLSFTAFRGVGVGFDDHGYGFTGDAMAHLIGELTSVAVTPMLPAEPTPPIPMQPPISAPPVSAPPVSAPPVSAPPVYVAPVSAPPLMSRRCRRLRRRRLRSGPRPPRARPSRCPRSPFRPCRRPRSPLRPSRARPCRRPRSTSHRPRRRPPTWLRPPRPVFTDPRSRHRSPRLTTSLPAPRARHPNRSSATHPCHPPL